MKGEHHRSGGSQCSKILTKKAEGELAHRIYKVYKHGFPIMGEKCGRLHLSTQEKTISKVSVPKKQPLGTSGYVASWGELKGLQ